LKYFKDEYIAHIVDKKCPAGVCKNLLSYEINPETCIGCSACSKKCPVGAIRGEVKKPFVIDQEKCIKCGVCQSTCRFGAVEKK
jgi:formate hydrogenlyase subunit 6/NADH:ubiquinone oxidoreductase subunit I